MRQLLELLFVLTFMNQEDKKGDAGHSKGPDFPEAGLMSVALEAERLQVRHQFHCWLSV